MFERHYRELLNFLARSVGCRQAAADLAQESYARVLSHQRAGGAVADARALLYRTARNLLVDRHRRGRLRQHEDLALLAAADQPLACACQQPEPALAARQSVDAYMAAIEGLPPRCREAFVLSVFEELSHAQIAAQMGISVSMVEKHIVRAMMACRAVRAEQEAA